MNKKKVTKEKPFVSGYDTMPDIEDLEKTVDRELKKLKDWEEKALQIVNLSPSESWVEKLTEVHPMKQITWAAIIQAVVFGFMLLSFSLISSFVHSESITLDLTLPETDFDFRQMEQDSFLIQDAMNKRLRFFDIENEPSAKTLRNFYILNFVDMSTSYHMTRHHPYLKESNFLLPGKPSAAEFILHKSVTTPLTAANLEEGQLVVVNWILAVIILKNVYLYETTCRQAPNYHHITGQNLNPC